jgi:hypothetical protein
VQTVRTMWTLRTQLMATSQASLQVSSHHLDWLILVSKIQQKKYNTVGPVNNEPVNNGSLQIASCFAWHRLILFHVSTIYFLWNAKCGNGHCFRLQTISSVANSGHVCISMWLFNGLLVGLSHYSDIYFPYL